MPVATALVFERTSHMSMLFDLRRISAAHLEFLFTNPNDIFFLLHGQEPYQPRKGFFRRVFGGREMPDQERKWEPPPEGMVMTLDQNWHVLHYLFCRSPEKGELPAATLLCGGREIGSVDVGYGPARALLPDQVEGFREFLSSLNKQSYGLDVTAEALEENAIYGAYPEWGEEDAERLWEYVEELKTFLAGAEKNRDGVVLYLY
jgi:hypothetical protein